MIKTPDLIEALVADAEPVRRLRPPTLRTALWLLAPLLVFALLVLGQGTRADLAQRLQQPDFIITVGAALLTGASAALAAFMLNVPGRSLHWAWLPVPAAALWMLGVGRACLTNWVALGPGGLEAGETARCFATVLITGLPLSLLLFAMLRRGSLLSGTPLVLTASLAVAAVSASALSLFHPLDASVLVLTWNVGLAAVIVAMGSLFGRRWTRAAP
jgi:hypothetical protein